MARSVGWRGKGRACLEGGGTRRKRHVCAERREENKEDEGCAGLYRGDLEMRTVRIVRYKTRLH